MAVSLYSFYSKYRISSYREHSGFFELYFCIRYILTFHDVNFLLHLKLGVVVVESPFCMMAAFVLSNVHGASCSCKGDMSASAS